MHDFGKTVIYLLKILMLLMILMILMLFLKASLFYWLTCALCYMCPSEWTLHRNDNIYNENIAVPLAEDYRLLLQEPAPKEYII